MERGRGRYGSRGREIVGKEREKAIEREGG